MNITLSALVTLVFIKIFLFLTVSNDFFYILFFFLISIKYYRFLPVPLLKFCYLSTSFFWSLPVNFHLSSFQACVILKLFYLIYFLNELDGLTPEHGYLLAQHQQCVKSLIETETLFLYFVFTSVCNFYSFSGQEMLQIFFYLITSNSFFF